MLLFIFQYIQAYIYNHENVVCTDLRVIKNLNWFLKKEKTAFLFIFQHSIKEIVKNIFCSNKTKLMKWTFLKTVFFVLGM